MKTIHLLIKGVVQGVFYRATAKEVADKLAICGWVKNTKEGDVEIIATGNEEKLKLLIEWCWKGPVKAKVLNIEISNVTFEHFDQFKIIRD